ncbi:MAG: hypothetical protein LBH09_00325 [Peptococcaceae bacterium]|jgi:hypothetical protein|nr:hypothetical protein [Peptococcaceae bacterium]
MAKTELAIIGLGFYAGEFDSVEGFLNGLMMSKKAFQTDQEGEVKYLSDAEALITRTLTEALWDARLSKSDLTKAAMVLHSAASLKERIFIQNGLAGQIAEQFGLGGPSYTVYDGDNSIFRGLTLAERIIEEALAEIICVCVAPPTELSDALQQKAEGAAVLILKEKDRALAEHNKIYACISATVVGEQISYQGPVDYASADNLNISKDVSKVLNEGGIRRRELRVIEVPGSRSAGFDDVTNKLCNERFKAYLDADATFVDTQRWLGRPSALAVAAAFVKNALQLSFFRVFIFEPGQTIGPSWFEKDDPSLWDAHGKKRAVLIACGPSGDEADVRYAAFTTLTECIDTMEKDEKLLSNTALLPLGADSPDALREKLVALQKGCMGLALDDLWAGAWNHYRSDEKPLYTAALLFDSCQSLMEEISYLLESLDGLTEGGGFKPGGRYESKRGSYFTADPYGADAKVVYMNPTGGMQQLSLFYKMLMYFPSFRHDYLTYLNSDIYRRMDKIDYRFGRFGIEMNLVGVANGIAAKRFGIKPDVLSGASMGELAVFSSYDALEYKDSPANNYALLQLMILLGKVYNYCPTKMKSMFISGKLPYIKSLVEKEPDVYILVEAAPLGAMVTGDPEAVDRIVAQGQGEFLCFVMSAMLSIHTPIVEHFIKPIYKAALKCKFKLKPDVGFEVYSTTLMKKMENTPEAIAEYTASVLTRRCNFYGLCEMLYDEGARVFVDVSTAGTSLWWAESIFEGRDAVCFSLYPPIFDSWGSQFRVFSKLLANHVKLDMDAFLDSFTHPFLEKC